VNKSELVEHMAKHGDISKASATRALDGAIRAIQTTLKKGGSVAIIGFGTFRVQKRAARLGRNPRTGQPLKIKARRAVKFTPGKRLTEIVN
jgi:DNA-binding protein HU-beta